MTAAVVIEPPAALELREAAAWYERKRMGLELVEEVGTVFTALAESDAGGLAVPGARADLPIRRRGRARERKIPRGRSARGG